MSKLHQIASITQDPELSNSGERDAGWRMTCSCSAVIAVGNYASKELTMKYMQKHLDFYNNTTRDIIPSAYAHRTLARKKFEGVETSGYDSYYYSYWADIDVPAEKAEIVSSELLYERGTHTIMLDIDMPAELRPSKTPGHFHLYIEKKLSWRQYKKLLKALMRAGVIERSWYDASVNDKATYLRVNK